MAEKVKKKFYKRWWFWVIAVIIVGGIASSGDSDSSKSATDTKPTTTEAAKKEEPKKEDTKVTYENFLKVKMGDKYDAVKALLGEGKEQSSSEVSGIKTVMYQWNGSGLGNMNVTIQNGVVTGKAQAYLKSTDAKITLDKYNQVKEGMTYDQVKAVLGEGEVSSQTKIANAESVMYSWINKDGSNMNATFTGGKMDMKAQFNLK